MEGSESRTGYTLFLVNDISVWYTILKLVHHRSGLLCFAFDLILVKMYIYPKHKVNASETE